MAADILRCGVDDDVGTEVNRPGQADTHGVVDDEGYPVFVGDLGESIKVRDVQPGVSDGLDKDATGLFGYLVFKCRWVVCIGKRDRSPEFREGLAEEFMRSPP